MIGLTLALLAQAAWNDNVEIKLRPLPPSAQEALASYRHCVSDRIAGWKAEKPFRQIAPEQVISSCATVRATARGDAIRITRSAPGFGVEEAEKTVDILLRLADRNVGVEVVNYAPAEGGKR
jgi:hypothetical protein